MDGFNDPLAWLEKATLEQRHGFELGLMYADMLSGSLGPWIVSDMPRHLIYQMAEAQGKMATIVYDSINTPEPKIAVTMKPAKPTLRVI